MKQKLLCLLVALTTASAQAHPALHLDPEMTAGEYQNIFAAQAKNPSFAQRIIKDPLNEVLSLGKRNLDWIEAINSQRDDEHKLQLTTPETTSAYPIDAPGISNPTIILAKLASLKQQMPAEMASVIFGSDTLPSTSTVDDKTFVENALELNRIYESASRWLLEVPNLEDYKQFAVNDIRGYYFLNKETDLNQKLKYWSNLDETTKNKYSEWLVNECVNTAGLVNTCDAGLTTAIKNGNVLSYHEKYVTGAAKIFNDYFELQNPRQEILWNHKNPNVMEMPLTNIARQDVQDWLKSNVEDEFRLNDWSLNINYSHKPNLAKVVFVPGTTPHVNDLGGDTIYMDANRPLQEYAIRWTIRHEFGHVLGLPDCYVEFYDQKQHAMINYQIDITNLMCSRRGHLQAKHYEQLKKYYYKG